MGFFSPEHRGMSFQAENTAWQISRSMRELSLRYSFIHSTNIVESLPHPRLSDKATNNREQNHRSLCPHTAYILVGGRQADKKLAK